MRKLTLGVIGVVVAVMTAACAADLQPSPTTTTPLPKAGAPATLELAISPGIGDQGGTATIGVHVLDAFGAPVVNLLVALTSTSGTMTPDQITTNEAGRGTATLVAAPGSVTVTASIANGPTRSAPVAVQPLPPPLPTPTPAPTPTPTPEPPLPPLTVTIFVTPQQAGQSTTFSLATQAISSATWDFGDGATVTTTIPFTSHVYGAAGSYPVTVIVRDTQGRTASASTTAVIPPAPPAPTPTPGASSLTLTLSCNPATHGLPTPCNVNATDSNGVVITSQITRVFWEFGDGTFLELTGPSAATTSHTYAQAGTYLVGATVTAKGATSSTSKSFTIP
jgi:PKD repeat protein